MITDKEIKKILKCKLDTAYTYRDVCKKFNFNGHYEYWDGIADGVKFALQILNNRDNIK